MNDNEIVYGNQSFYYYAACQFLDSIGNIKNCKLDVTFKKLFGLDGWECPMIRTIPTDNPLSGIKRLSKEDQQKQQELYGSFFIKLLLFSESLDKEKRNLLNDKIDCALKILENPEFQFPEEVSNSSLPKNLIQNILKIKDLLAQKREEFEKEKEAIILKTKIRLNCEGNVLEKEGVNRTIALQSKRCSWEKIETRLNIELRTMMIYKESPLTFTEKWTTLIDDTKNNFIQETREAFDKLSFEVFPVTSGTPKSNPQALETIKHAGKNGLKIAFKESDGKIIPYCYSKWNLLKLIKNLLHSEKQKYLYTQFFRTLISTNETLNPEEQASLQKEIDACQQLLYNKANPLSVVTMDPLDKTTIKNLERIESFFLKEQRNFRIAKEQTIRKLVQQKTQFPKIFKGEDLWFQKRAKSIEFNRIASTVSWEEVLKTLPIGPRQNLEEWIVQLAQGEDQTIENKLKEISNHLKINRRILFQATKIEIKRFNNLNNEIRNSRIKELKLIEDEFRQECLEEGKKLYAVIPGFSNDSSFNQIMQEYIDEACSEIFGEKREILLASLEQNLEEFSINIAHFKNSFIMKSATAKISEFLEMRSKIKKDAWEKWIQKTLKLKRRLFEFSQTAFGSDEVLRTGLCYAINYRWTIQINRNPTKPITSVRDLDDPANIPENSNKPTPRDRKNHAASKMPAEFRKTNPQELYEKSPKEFYKEKLKRDDQEIPKKLRNNQFIMHQDSEEGRSIGELIEKLDKDRTNWKNQNGVFAILACGGMQGHALGMQIDDTNKIYRFWDVNSGLYEYDSLEGMKEDFIEYMKAFYESKYNRFFAKQFVPSPLYSDNCS